MCSFSAAYCRIDCFSYGIDSTVYGSGAEKNSQEWFAKGLYAFSLGLAKKVLLADTLGLIVNTGFADVGSLDTTNVVIVMLSYALQIYFDFSGYCDMARGIGYMFHIELPINFNSPYKAASVQEFWKRWHITLIRFLTKYCYIPLGEIGEESFGSIGML